MAEFAERYPDFYFQINMKGVASGYISLTDAMIGVIRSVHPTLALPDSLPAIRGTPLRIPPHYLSVTVATCA
jgi:hypothetical protein